MKNLSTPKGHTPAVDQRLQDAQRLLASGDAAGAVSAMDEAQRLRDLFDDPEPAPAVNDAAATRGMIGK